MGEFEKHKILVVAKVEGETPESYIKKIDENLCLWNDMGNIEAHYPFEAPYLQLPEKPLDGFVFSTLDDYSGINLVGDWEKSDFADLVRLYAIRHGINIWNDEVQDIEHITQAIRIVTGLDFSDYGKSTLSRINPNFEKYKDEDKARYERVKDLTHYDLMKVRTIFCWECKCIGLSNKKIAMLIPNPEAKPNTPEDARCLRPARIGKWFKKDSSSLSDTDEKCNFYELKKFDKDFEKLCYKVDNQVKSMVKGEFKLVDI